MAKATKKKQATKAEERADMPKEIAGVVLYPIKEVAKLLGVSERTATKWVTSGELRAKKIAQVWHITEEELRSFVATPDELPANEDSEQMQANGDAEMEGKQIDLLTGFMEADDDNE